MNIIAIVLKVYIIIFNEAAWTAYKVIMGYIAFYAVYPSEIEFIVARFV